MISKNIKADELEWSPAIPGGPIGSNEIHVWLAPLDLPFFEIEQLSKLLSPDELGRAFHFRFDKDQHRFIAARGILRQLLGNYLETDPVSIAFNYGSNGKPSLASGHLSFNISHSDSFALYAIARTVAVGIDIEFIREDVATSTIAGRFFSASEIHTLKMTGKENQAKTFFQYWTRKEAFLKAIGEGVSFPMERCDVSQINGTVLSSAEIENDHDEYSNWFIQDLFPTDGYAAAIAVKGNNWEISCRQSNPPPGKL